MKIVQERKKTKNSLINSSTKTCLPLAKMNRTPELSFENITQPVRALLQNRVREWDVPCKFLRAAALQCKHTSLQKG